MIELGRFWRRFWDCTMYFKVPLSEVYFPFLCIYNGVTIIHGGHGDNNVISCQSSDISWRVPSPFSELHIDNSHDVTFGFRALYGLLNGQWVFVSFRGYLVCRHKMCSHKIVRSTGVQ